MKRTTLLFCLVIMVTLSVGVMPASGEPYRGKAIPPDAIVIKNLFKSLYEREPETKFLGAYKKSENSYIFYVMIKSGKIFESSEVIRLESGIWIRPGYTPGRGNRVRTKIIEK